MAGIAPDDIDFLQTYDDYPVIVMMQIEDLGFCAKGEAPAFVRAHDLTTDGDFPAQYLGRPVVGRPGRRRRRLSRSGRGAPPAHRRGRRHRCPTRGSALVSGFGMINYDRGLASPRRSAGARMTEPLHPPAPQGSAAQNARAAAAAGRAQPHRAWPDRRRRGRPLRVAGLRGLRRSRCIRRATPARAACPRGVAFQRRAGGGTRARRNHDPHQHRCLFPRAHALADRHRRAGLRARRSSRICTATSREGERASA